jgi:hypothetical protein
MRNVRTQLRQRHRNEWRQACADLRARVRAIGVDFNKPIEQRAAGSQLCSDAVLAQRRCNLSVGAQRKRTACVYAAT